MSNVWFMYGIQCITFSIPPPPTHPPYSSLKMQLRSRTIKRMPWPGEEKKFKSNILRRKILTWWQSSVSIIEGSADIHPSSHSTPFHQFHQCTIIISLTYSHSEMENVFLSEVYNYLPLHSLSSATERSCSDKNRFSRVAAAPLPGKLIVGDWKGMIIVGAELTLRSANHCD